MSSSVMIWWGKKTVSEQGPTVPKYVGGLCMCVAHDTCGHVAHNACSACRHVVFLMRVLGINSGKANHLPFIHAPASRCVAVCA